MEIDCKRSEETSSATSENDDDSQHLSLILANMGKEKIAGAVYQKWWSEIPILEELKKMKGLELFDVTFSPQANDAESSTDVATAAVDNTTNKFSPLIDNIHKVRLEENVIYQQWLLPISVDEMFQKMKDLEVFDNDVISTGFPRSGNHWTHEVVYMILNQTTDYAPYGFIEGSLDLKVASPDGLDNFPSPRQLVTHNRPSRFPTQALEKRIKMIFLLRNPKDVLASMYVLWTRFRPDHCVFKGSWDQFLDLSLNSEFTYGSWFDHTLAVEKFIEENPQIPTYVHVYEEMKENPAACIRKLCAFLEKPDTMAEEIAAATEFKRMQEFATKLAWTEEYLFLGKDNPTLLRKGVIGDWKNTFTVAQNEKFDKMYREKMANSKLARRIEKYLDIL